MKIFIDTANVAEIEEIAKLGILSGVTTNPSLIAKQGERLEDVIPRICQLVDGPISAEVLGETKEEMLTEARALAKIHANIVVKIPMTAVGLEVVSQLAKEGIKTNVTLIFNAAQALFAARAGASYVSPFVGRIDDLGYAGNDMVSEVAQIFQIHGITTEIIAASIRTVNDVVNAALVGSHIATIPYPIIKSSMKHVLTDIGVEKFNTDAKNAKK